MSVHEPTPFRAATPSVDADRAMKFGVGVAAAPLWATFFTAAGAGMAYWWMTAWARGEPTSFAPMNGAARAAAGATTAVPTVEAAPRRPEPAQAVVTAPAPELKPEPELAPEPAPPVVEGPHPLHAPEPGALVAAAPVAAGLESAVEPAEIAAVAEQVRPAQAAPRGDGAGAKAQAPSAAQRRPPGRRKPERKA